MFATPQLLPDLAEETTFMHGIGRHLGLRITSEFDPDLDGLVNGTFEDFPALHKPVLDNSLEFGDHKNDMSLEEVLEASDAGEEPVTLSPALQEVCCDANDEEIDLGHESTFMGSNFDHSLAPTNNFGKPFESFYDPDLESTVFGKSMCMNFDQANDFEEEKLDFSMANSGIEGATTFQRVMKDTSQKENNYPSITDQLSGTVTATRQIAALTSPYRAALAGSRGSARKNMRRDRTYTDPS